MVIRALRAPETRHAVLRFRMNAVRQSVGLDTFPKVMRLCYPNVPYKEHRQDGYFELPNGSEIWMGGLDEAERVEKILGMEFITILFNESSQIPYASVVIALTRLAQVSEFIMQRAYYDLNPIGKSHWSNRMFGDHVDPSTRKPLDHPENYRRMFINPEDNRRNLSNEFIESLKGMPEKQMLRFYKGLYVDEISDALWTLEKLEACRVEEVTDDNREALLAGMVQIVVGVDPSGASGPEDKRSDEIGIIVCGRDARGVAHVFADRSLRDAPEIWGSAVSRAWTTFKGDRVIGEKNFGGDMVRFVIKTANALIPVVTVNASRGKHVRAEPISVLYDQKKVVHHGIFVELEEQMCAFNPSGYQGAKSPDRADALIWALTALMVVGATDEDIGLPTQVGAGEGVQHGQSNN